MLAVLCRQTLLLQDIAVAPLLVILPLIAGAGPQSSQELGVLSAQSRLPFGGSRRDCTTCTSRRIASLSFGLSVAGDNAHR